MAAPMQKTAEEKETAQIKQFAGLVNRFNLAQFEFYKQFAAMSDKPNSPMPNSFLTAKADFDANFKKLTEFAVTHVPLLMRMMDNQDYDEDAVRVIKDIKATSYNLSYSSSLFANRTGASSTMDAMLDVPHVVLWGKTKSGNVPLLYFYDAGKEGPEKNAGIAVYPAEELFKDAMLGHPELKSGKLVPKKVE